jgi:hypothetical protein
MKEKRLSGVDWTMSKTKLLMLLLLLLLGIGIGLLYGDFKPSALLDPAFLVVLGAAMLALASMPIHDTF